MSSPRSFLALILWRIAAVIVIVVAVHLLRWLYRRSTKETAFVRTGFMGEKVVIKILAREDVEKSRFTHERTLTEARIFPLDRAGRRPAV